MNFQKLNKLKSKKITRWYVIAWFGMMIYWGYWKLTNDSEPDPEPHWGEWISLTILAILCATILGMVIWKFWPSHWKKDPENNQLKIREAMKIFELQT